MQLRKGQYHSKKLEIAHNDDDGNMSITADSANTISGLIWGTTGIDCHACTDEHMWAEMVPS